MNQLLKNIRKYINYSPRISAVIAGILCSIAHAPIFFCPGLIGFSLLLYLVYSSASAKEAFVRNICFGYGYFGYGFYWTAIAIGMFMEDFWWAIPIALMGLPLIFCVFIGIISVLAWRCRYNSYYVLIYTVLWVFVEWLTTWIFTGLPWMLVGYTVGFSDILSQMAGIAGVLGLSFIIFNITGTFYYIWNGGAILLRKDLLYSFIVLGSVFIFGLLRLEAYPTSFLTTKIRIVQPSIPQNQKWDPDIFWKNLELHKELSSIKTGFKPDIILWSEAAVTAPYQIHIISKYLGDIAKKQHATLITGGVSEINDKTYTALFSIGPDGKLLFEYHKRHLVPFGEYMPFREFIPIKKLTHGIADYTEGQTQKIFNIESLGVKIRPMICYESIFPEEIRTQGADLLVNVTNSAWYGNSSAPYHLFYTNKFRAIENGMPVITSSNNGISGIIDPVGRVLSKTKLNDIISLDGYIPQKIQSHTTYSLLGLIAMLIVMSFMQCIRIISNKIK